MERHMGYWLFASGFDSLYSTKVLKCIINKWNMKKYIHVTSEDRQFLAKAFNVSNVTVWKALRFEQDTDTIRRIQKAARERGGIVMAVAPVMETLHDHDNVIRQYFPNGALLEISKNDSTGVVTYKGEEVRHYDNVTFSNINSIQNFAAALK